jgi:hypothetical protein
MFRQGDVLLIPTSDRIPQDAKPEQPESGRMILMHGEATGHAHAVLERDATIRSRGTGMTMERWLDVHKATSVVHEEHAAIPLQPGVYRILRQREYSPEAIRNVAD